MLGKPEAQLPEKREGRQAEKSKREEGGDRKERREGEREGEEKNKEKEIPNSHQIEK